MTPETREALKELAQGVKFMAGRHAVDSPADFEFYRDLITCAERLYLALEQEKSHGECSGVEITPWAELTRKREAMIKAIATDYETWRDEQLDTLRKLFRQCGPSEEYKSFPDFCLEQFDGSGKGKVKI